jgi:hypothetical protein
MMGRFGGWRRIVVAIGVLGVTAVASGQASKAQGTVTVDIPVAAVGK